MRRRALHCAALLAAFLIQPGAGLAQDEVPFITTPDAVTLAMLELAQVGPSDRLIDLGSGDGRIVITAAKKFGASGLGVEIVPDLVATSRSNALKAGVADRALFREQDLFATDLGGFTVVTLYLLPELNLQLRPRLLALPAGTRIVSHDWDMGDWLPERTLTLDVPDKTIGREKKSRVHLWLVPAQVQGLWCTASGSWHGSLQITQRFQRFSATLLGKGAAAPALVFDGHIAATDLHSQADSGELRARLQLQAGALRVLSVAPAGHAFEHSVFTRAAATSCP